MGICYLDYDALLHTAPETDHFEGSFAPYVTLIINGAYILYEGSSTSPAQNSSKPAPRPTLSDSESDDTEPRVLSATGPTTAADGVSIVHRLATADPKIQLPKR